MAYTTINKSTDYFRTKLYTGNASNDRAITFDESTNMQPDFIWIKNRSATQSHALFDSVRGATKRLTSNGSGTESTENTNLDSFDTNGFTVDNEAIVNGSGNSMVAWNWKAGTTGSGNTGGSGTYKTYSYSVNTTAGFSVVKYVGNGTAGHTVPHHLGAAADYVIVKALGNTESWQVISKAMDADKFIQLNSSDAQISQGSYNMFNSTRPSSTVVTLGNQNHTNQDGTNYIMYAFAEKTGYSKFGRYRGNGTNTQAPFIYTGFKPAFVLLKENTGSDNWLMMDNKRLGYNNRNDLVFSNLNNAEQGHDRIDLLSNGFKINNDDGSINQSGQTYIYMAFGQSLVGSNNVPCTAR